MKKRTKGILAFAFLGGIMVTSGVVIAIPGITPDDPSMQFTPTGTPADNFPDIDRPRFCGSSNPKSTNYVTEYAIPTECTNPLAITMDDDGDVWFAQTNTGNIAKFDVETENFTEYDNPNWPRGARSMMWGMDYAPDGTVWFTDETHDSLWQFFIENQTYARAEYPSGGDALPQRLSIEGTRMIVNDFSGNKLTFLNVTGEQLEYSHLISPLQNAATADFVTAPDGFLWFTTWQFQQGGALIRLDQNSYLLGIELTGADVLPLLNYIQVFDLPSEIQSPNGIEADQNGKIWLADTGSSFFFSFDPRTEQFTRYVTAKPTPSVFGNQTGVVLDPISRPYWMVADDQGRIIFNSQTSNNISVLDPLAESLVEYSVPSQNPYWSDCETPDEILMANCGVAQVFDLTTHGKKIWFTEWVENNIGVVDTGVVLPANISIANPISVQAGQSAEIDFTIEPAGPGIRGVLYAEAADHISAQLNTLGAVRLDGSPLEASATISTPADAPAGQYKVLVGIQLRDVAIGKFVTVTVT